MSPPAVRPYVEGQTGSLSDVIERGPELAPFTPAGPGGFAPDPTWSEMFHAGLPAARRSTVIPDDTPLLNAYTPIVDALGLPPSENPARFYDADPNTLAVTGALGQPSALATAAQQGESLPFGSQRLATRHLQESLIVDQIKARRAKDPNWGPGIPDTIEGIHSYADQQDAKARAAGAKVLARGSGFGRFTAGLAAGGLESALHDPSFLPSMVLGGGTATSLVQAVGRDALINGVFAAVYAPAQIYRSVAEDHEPLTTALGEAATNIVAGAAIGAVAGGTVHLGRMGGEHVPPALFKAMPESVQTRWAGRMKVGENGPLLRDVLGDMDNRELSGFARSTIGTRMTPDEKAAASVLERSQELGEASPFEPGPEGDAAHNANLAASLKSIIDGAPAGRADLLSTTSAAGLRPPEPVAVPGDAGFDRQWAAIKGNEHGIGAHGEFLTSPKGAIGPAQVMPGTAPYAAKLAGLAWDEARYRGDAAYNEALGRAYYAEQLRTFGDPDMAAAAYNAGPGSTARGTGLRGALRRAAEHGEPGNWEAYLPRETQAYVEDFRKRTGGAAGEPAIADVGGEDPALAELRQSADDAEAQALELSRDRASAEPVPLLKREMFAADQQWADAQAAFHQSLNAPEEAAGAPLSSETPSGPPELAAAAAAGAGAADELTPASYVDAYLRGEGRGDSARDRELLQFAANNGPAIEQEFRARATAAVAARPATREEIEALAPIGPDGSDPLRDAALQNAAAREAGKPPKSVWAIRDKATGDIVGTWADRKPFEKALAGMSDRARYEPLSLAPENVDLELKLRAAAESAAAASVADVRIDEPALKAFDQPGGAGAKEQAASLEHDARLDVEQQNREVAVAVLDRLTSAGKLPRSPMSLIEFLAKRGGINDFGGELRAMGLASLRGFARRGERKLINPRGAAIDDAFAAAIKAGYFPQFNGVRGVGRMLSADLPDTNVLLEALDKEIRGEPVYADVDQAAVFERARSMEGDAWVSSHVDDLQGLADKWGVALDEGTLEHALTDVGRGTGAEEALSNAVTAAAMRDLGSAVADTGDLRYGTDNEGRPWDDEVNYAEQGETAAAGRAPGAGERRPAAQAANAPPGGAVAGEHEGPTGAPAELGARRYQLDETSPPKTLAEILDEIDRDKAAAAALRSCAEGGGE